MNKTRLYEGMFLIDSNLAAKDWSALETHVNDILKKNRAELVYSEKWPDRRLAYEVAGCKKGTYYLTYFNAPPEVIKEIDRDTRLSERVLRHLIVQEEGLAREMERRKNREITAPPADLSFEDDRFEVRDFGFGGRGRRPAEPERERERTAPAETPAEPAASPAEAPAGEESDAT